VSASIPPLDVPNHEENEDSHARAAAALQAAFARLAPQGSDQWNFLAAFTHLGDRYGPYHPGASALSDSLASARADGPKRSGRLLGKKGRQDEAAGGELAEAMAQVVEAFRFLSARVQTLEERLAREDRPVEGAAWLAPAQDLATLTGPIASHLVARRPPQGGPVVHGDCGSGGLLIALREEGVEAEGVEPRGSVALEAIEQGCQVAIRELLEDLSARQDASLGGLVLSGVVDRVPLHVLLELLGRAQRVLELGAPLVVVIGEAGSDRRWGDASREVIAGRPLGLETWELLLDRFGFVNVAPLSGGETDRRLVVTASVPE
jgi:hypothetical protein